MSIAYRRLPIGLSKNFYYKNKGYQLQDGCIKYIVYWQKENTDIEVKIVLPELKLQKVTGR